MVMGQPFSGRTSCRWSNPCDASGSDSPGSRRWCRWSSRPCSTGSAALPPVRTAPPRRAASVRRSRGREARSSLRRHPDRDRLRARTIGPPAPQPALHRALHRRGLLQGVDRAGATLAVRQPGVAHFKYGVSESIAAFTTPAVILLSSTTTFVWCEPTYTNC